MYVSMLKVYVLLQEEVGGGGVGAREEEGGGGEAAQGGQGQARLLPLTEMLPSLPTCEHRH